MHKIQNWLIPLFTASLLFVAIRPVLAQAAGEGINDYLKSNNVEVGSAPGENGYRQIFYIYDGKRTFITNTNYTNANPVTEKEYIVWSAQIDNGWKIMAYNILSSQTIELTPRGISTNPQIAGGNIIWEGQDQEGKWQIFLFNGISVKQLTFDEVSINAVIEGDFVAFSTLDITGTWRGRVYSVSQDRLQDIAVGEEMQKIKLADGEIYTGEEKFPLKVSDLFLLDFAPFAGEEATASSEVTPEDIMEEIEATPSAEASESGILNLESRGQ